ncbi:hypothetical protein IPZ58_07740 [Streptomyces roseoverticillatus]|uniref:hypothetical protein n=1 Tax=Streptomyces roseoverticillatus TaxID=66429 RepID=UPI001F1CB2A5|nr:hypothetical protein [Streptomyces roseoverticillatus]MCF3101471.1 hypothetical protein [Streptomyces roseoverticillatus]
MARIRTIKPEFFTSLTIADLPLSARLTFIGLWTHVDDDGRCVDEPRLVRAAVWPLDDRTAGDVEDDLRRLHDASLIVRYEHSGRRYLAVRSWREHQRIDKAKPSKLPAPATCRQLPPEPADDAPTCDDAEFPDESESDPGRVHDGSTTRPGRVPVGKEQGTGNREGNREREGAGTREPHSPAEPPAQTLSLITPTWQPSEHDQAAAAADIARLGPEATLAATGKFVRHHTAKATQAADFGPLWISWLTRERPDPAPSTVVPFDKPNKTSQQRAALAAAREIHREKGMVQ